RNSTRTATSPTTNSSSSSTKWTRSSKSAAVQPPCQTQYDRVAIGQATAPGATTCFPSSCPPASAPANIATAAPLSPKIVPEKPNTNPAFRIQQPNRPLPLPLPLSYLPSPISYLPGTSTSASPCPTPSNSASSR